MSTRDLALAMLSLVIAGCAGRAAVSETPKLGQPVRETDIAGWDISIAPDGAGLPADQPVVRLAGTLGAMARLALRFVDERALP